MLDFVDYMYILVVSGGFTVILIILTRYQLDLAIDMMNKDIANKMKTFPATLAKSRGSNREPSNMETIVSLAQTFIEMKAQGISIKDILSEFGVSAAEETVKKIVSPTKDT